jgi:hypothetical protein
MPGCRTLPGRTPLPDVSEHVPPLPTLAVVGSQAGRHSCSTWSDSAPCASRADDAGLAALRDLDADLVTAGRCAVAVAPPPPPTASAQGRLRHRSPQPLHLSVTGHRGHCSNVEYKC